MNKKIIFSALLLTLSTPSRADLTGAGDVAIITQLVEMVEQGHQQIMKLKEALNISKKMEQFEQLKVIKKISDEAQALHGLIEDVKHLEDDVNDLIADPFTLDPIEREIEWITRKMRRAEGSDDAVKSYARILMELKNLKFLGAATAKSKEKLRSGTNNEANQQISASSDLICAELLIKSAKRQQLIDANNTSIMLKTLKNRSYSSMASEDNL